MSQGDVRRSQGYLDLARETETETVRGKERQAECGRRVSGGQIEEDEVWLLFLRAYKVKTSVVSVSIEDTRHIEDVAFTVHDREHPTSVQLCGISHVFARSIECACRRDAIRSHAHNM